MPPGASAAGLRLRSRSARARTSGIRRGPSARSAWRVRGSHRRCSASWGLLALNVKPDSNWSRPGGTTVLAGVKVGRSVLIGPSGSSSCDTDAQNRSKRLGWACPTRNRISISLSPPFPFSASASEENGCSAPVFPCLPACAIPRSGRGRGRGRGRRDPAPGRKPRRGELAYYQLWHLYFHS